MLASKRGLPSVGFSQPHTSRGIQRCAWKVGLRGYMELNIVTPCTLLMYQSAPPTKIQPYPPRRFVLPLLQPATCVPSASGMYPLSPTKGCSSPMLQQRARSFARSVPDTASPSTCTAPCTAGIVERLSGRLMTLLVRSDT